MPSNSSTSKRSDESIFICSMCHAAIGLLFFGGKAIAVDSPMQEYETTRGSED